MNEPTPTKSIFKSKTAVAAVLTAAAGAAGSIGLTEAGATQRADIAAGVEKARIGAATPGVEVP